MLALAFGKSWTCFYPGPEKSRARHSHVGWLVVNAEHARSLAGSHLAAELPRRWRHVQGVASRAGTALWAGNVRRSFRAVLATAGLDPADWTPRELRHSFVSLMSDAGVPIEKIARLVGHTGTTTTETVYRKQIRPVVVGGAEVMDTLFPSRDTDA
jgi:integrase